MSRLMGYLFKLFVGSLLLGFCSMYFLTARPIGKRSIEDTIYPKIVVSTPVFRVDGKVVDGVVGVKHDSKVSLSTGPGEKLILNFNYIQGHPLSEKDIKIGHYLNVQQLENLNIGAFITAPRGTLWVVSCYAEKDGIRGDTAVVVFTHL